MASAVDNPTVGSRAAMTEAEFSRQVLDLARLFGWRRYHAWLSACSEAGFPDEVLVRPPRLVLAELKSERGALTPTQSAWLEDLRAAGAEVYMRRPSELAVIAEVLR